MLNLEFEKNSLKPQGRFRSLPSIRLKDQAYIYFGDNYGFLKVWDITEVIKTYEPVPAYRETVGKYLPFR